MLVLQRGEERECPSAKLGGAVAATSRRMIGRQQINGAAATGGTALHEPIASNADAGRRQVHHMRAHVAAVDEFDLHALAS